MQNLKGNWKLYIVALLFVVGAGLYMFDQPVSDGYLEGTLVTTPAGNPITNDQTTMIVELENGTHIKLKNLLGVTSKVGKRVEIERKTRPIMGFSEYQFVRYLQ